MEDALVSINQTQLVQFETAPTQTHAPSQMVIRHLGADKGTGAEMSPAVVNGIVTADVPVSYWPIFSPCPW